NKRRKMHDVLIIEDNESLREILKEALAGGDYNVTDCGNAEDALVKLKESGYDLVITDLKLPGIDGITFMEQAKSERPGTEFIVITAHGNVDAAVSAMKKGASDFITKPFSLDHIRLQAARVLASKKLRDENAALKMSLRHEIIGNSAGLKEALGLAEKAAASDANVLITGESGTGKELIAEEIHYRSPRAKKSLVKVNCAALAPGVLESELFGHEKGAFTDALNAKKGRFELADGGTIFLDEIADLPLNLQVKLLRVVQEKTFERVGGEKTIKSDVRVIAATNKDLREAVKQGKFREDLFYRFNVVEISVPPLRERKGDIPVLAEYFMKKYAEYGGFRIKGITKQALEALAGYDFPGNIRELENVIQRVMVLSRGPEITAEDLPYEIQAEKKAAKTREGLQGKKDEYEKKMIMKALEEAGGNRARAAKALKVGRTALLAKIKKYGL
ncbi:MAG TPA: sigma-54 dependent transcriptional regulator, partial [Candidatus Goldiibacteriota bacterium]|nr:sigma-54 dependent transcriptional regulator [Candidatus Goldiibacteriota bacterium]